jgi:hypothetical protein
MQGQVRLNENLQTARFNRDTGSSVQNRQKSFLFQLNSTVLYITWFTITKIYQKLLQL